MISSDSALLSLLDSTIRKHRLFGPDDTVIVALSGGADSTAMLDILTRLPGYNLRLIVGHLNHHLRGVESDADEEFCRQLAAGYKIPFESKGVDVMGIAKSGGMNLEDAGRRARIYFLSQLRERHGATAVAVAHHADDQAETILMRLIRGSGMTGLSGMPYRNSSSFVRPLLNISRSDIEQYLQRHSLKWREDASNRDTTFLRNRIRHELLPLLEGYNPAIRSTLSSTASVISGDETLLDELTEQAFSRSCRMVGGTVVCGVRELLELSPPLRRRVLRHGFKNLVGNLEGLSLRHSDSICDMLDSPRPNSRLALPQSVTVAREYDQLSFMQTSVTVRESAPDILVTAPGDYHLPGGGLLTVEISEPPGDYSTLSPDTVFINPGKAGFPWLLRTFRPGDRIVPFGMSGRKKVKEIFIDRKIPLSERKKIPLLFSGSDLIWIAGVCASELCRVDDSSGVTVRVKWEARL